MTTLHSIRSVTLTVDVSDVARLGISVQAVATVTLPGQLDPDRPVAIVFALPGAGYNRSYFTLDLPNGTSTPNEGGQAGWHARRGWIFVAIDTLGVGEASLPDPADLDLNTLTAVNDHIVRTLLQGFADGTIEPGLPPVAQPVTMGLGQSMGGGLTIVQQAHFDTFDAIAILGFSAVWTSTRNLPGARPAGVPFISRDTILPRDVLSHDARLRIAANSRLLNLQNMSDSYPNKQQTPPGWHFHFDDVPEKVRIQDLGASSPAPPWRSPTVPGAVFQMLAPGSLGPEAAAIVVPILSAFGERDVTEDPRMEHKAFRHAVDFTSFTCPRMGHMHNFATTREILWSRIHHWGKWVVDVRSRLSVEWPSDLFSDSY